jgi:hypothetical protein
VDVTYQTLVRTMALAAALAGAPDGDAASFSLPPGTVIKAVGNSLARLNRARTAVQPAVSSPRFQTES